MPVLQPGAAKLIDSGQTFFAKCFKIFFIKKTFLPEKIIFLFLHSQNRKGMVKIDPWCNGSTTDFGSVS